VARHARKAELDEEAEFARLQRWDRKIEADFRRAVAETKAAGRAKRGRRLVAFPWAFLVDVCRLTEGQAALAIAAFVYRRTYVCRSLTVTLPGAELTEIGVYRKKKQRALASLEAAGIIRCEKSGRRSVRVTLLWQSR
jgi:hypothetical protein